MLSFGCKKVSSETSWIFSAYIMWCELTSLWSFFCAELLRVDNSVQLDLWKSEIYKIATLLRLKVGSHCSVIIPDRPWLWSGMITDRLWCLCSHCHNTSLMYGAYCLYNRIHNHTSLDNHRAISVGVYMGKLSLKHPNNITVIGKVWHCQTFLTKPRTLAITEEQLS